MICTDVTKDYDYPNLIRSESEEMGQIRSPNLHLTPIIRDIEQTIRPKDEWCTEEELRFFGSVGFLWERVFGKCFADAVRTGDLVRPGEFELDGIIGSPDIIRQSDWTLIETKATWKSVRKFDDHLDKYFWAWLVQTMGYAKMVCTRVVELHVFFVCGDWRPPLPTTRVLRIEYEEIEIEENWAMLKGHARRKGWLR